MITLPYGHFILARYCHQGPSDLLPHRFHKHNRCFVSDTNNQWFGSSSSVALSVLLLTKCRWRKYLLSCSVGNSSSPFPPPPPFAISTTGSQSSPRLSSVSPPCPFSAHRNLSLYALITIRHSIDVPCSPDLVLELTLKLKVAGSWPG